MTALLPLLALLSAASPFEAEQPEVRAGNEALRAGDPAAALPRYQAAEADAGPHPEIDFDRGHALLQSGRAEEARAAWRRAAEKGAGPLASRALQNTANALDAAGDQAGAIRALGEALQRDPANEDARYNLEVLLRRKAAGKGAPRDEGPRGKPKPGGERQQGAGDGPQDQQDQGRQKAQPEPGPGGQPQAAQRGDRRREQERRDAGTSSAGDEKTADRDAAAGRRAPLGAQDAERLLDAMRSRERTMPLGPAGTPTTRRETSRDW